MDKHQHYDFLIAGQGLAGSLLAWELIHEGKKVLVVDSIKPENSSRVAAGMIHPVTGRRLSKSWRADLLIAYAISVYREMEKLTAKKLFHEVPVLEVYSDHGNRNDWHGKTADPEFQKYIGEECNAGKVHPGVIAPLGGQWIQHGGWLDMELFLDSMQEFLLTQDSFMEGEIKSEELKITSDGNEWKNLTASTFVNCTGSNASSDPYWNWLPFLPAKGEMLVIESNQLPTDYIIHHTLKVIPLGENQFRVGATYSWNEDNNLPTDEGEKKLVAGLAKTIKAPYTIRKHQAGIRPSTHDRRAYLGRHPQFPQLAIFNGLGSKGVTEGPWLAMKMVNFLLGKETLEMEYSIERCKEKFVAAQ